MWSDQASQGANGLTWELIFTRKCKELVNLVKERKRGVKGALYAEKIDHEFTPFTSMTQVAIFLLCYSGLLRHESMFLGELSDMLHIEYQKSSDSDPFFIMVMQIATGKSSCAFRFLFSISLTG